jgi:Legionella pneumophila major outer membrane protein precursor
LGIMAKDWTKSRSFLYAGVSVIALAAASPQVRGADLTRPALFVKAPVAVVRDEWNVWVEGGAFWTGGGNVHVGDPIDVGRVQPGGEGAAGFDYWFGGTPWHLSGQVRYGAAKTSGVFTRNGAVTVPTICTTAPCGSSVANVPANGTFASREDHWLVDFAAGRDIGLGSAQTQLKAGLRIAEIRAKTTGGAGFVAPTGFCTFFANSIGFCSPVGFVGAAPGAFAFAQRSKFLGVGPRVGLDGTVPLGGGFALDWLGGVAVLFGDRSLDVTTTGNAATFGIFPLGVSSTAAILNFDAQVGLSYWFTPNVKMTGSYRFDGYWGALKTINAAGAIVNEDRFFAGPMLRLTVKNP